MKRVCGPQMWTSDLAHVRSAKNVKFSKCKVCEKKITWNHAATQFFLGNVNTFLTRKFARSVLGGGSAMSGQNFSLY